jgi:hypothetical protein
LRNLLRNLLFYRTPPQRYSSRYEMRRESYLGTLLFPASALRG